MSEPLHNFRPAFELQGRNHMVTGGAQGIGCPCADTSAIYEQGGNVVVMDVQENPVDEKA